MKKTTKTAKIGQIGREMEKGYLTLSSATADQFGRLQTDWSSF